MTRLFTKLIRSCCASTGLKALLVAAVAGALPTAALADHREHERDFHGYRDYREDHGGARLDVDLHAIIGGRTPDCVPVYEDRPTQVWVPPVYRTVTDRVWVAPVVQTVLQHVWVPDRCEWRDVVRYEWGHRRVVRQLVVVQPGHYEDRPGEAVVSPGHFEDVTRQELVVPGHWETRIERVAVAPPPVVDESHARLDIHLPVRW